MSPNLTWPDLTYTNFGVCDFSRLAVTDWHLRRWRLWFLALSNAPPPVFLRDRYELYVFLIARMVLGISTRENDLVVLGSVPGKALPLFWSLAEFRFCRGPIWSDVAFLECSYDISSKNAEGSLSLVDPSCRRNSFWSEHKHYALHMWSAFAYPSSSGALKLADSQSSGRFSEVVNNFF